MADVDIQFERVALSAIPRGLTLPAPLLDPERPEKLLLNRGIRLTEPLVRRLMSRGISHVLVDRRYASALREPPKRITPPPARGATDCRQQLVTNTPPRSQAFPVAQQELMAETRQRHSQLLQQIFSAVTTMLPVAGRTLKSISTEAVQCLSLDLDLFVSQSLQPHADAEFFEHSMRVGHLAMSVGAANGLSRDQVFDLGVGCLVNRLGMSEEGRYLTSLPRALTRGELLEIRKHPGKTFDLIQNAPDISAGARQVAYQMNERWNGGGYPRGRAGLQINPLARLAAVCDVYVALTTNRPHRPPMPRYQAIHKILAMAQEKMFDPESVRALIRTIALYPLGSFVRLSDGRVGRVHRGNRTRYDRPSVEIVWDRGPTTEKAIVDLETHEYLTVTEVMNADQIDRILAAEGAALRERERTFETALFELMN